MPKSEKHTHDLPPQALRAEAMESLLLEKGFLIQEDIDKVVQRFQNQVGPLNGAKVVARAWVDSPFKKRLLENGKKALEEFQFEMSPPEQLDVLENSQKVHHVVTCTLCSCYPWAVLGLPPKWYKDPAYRSRIVREPRKVLAEMGLTLEEGVEIKVWDSSAEIRYLVLPERPKNTENLSEEELVHRVTRDSMIGVARL